MSEEFGGFAGAYIDEADPDEEGLRPLSDAEIVQIILAYKKDSEDVRKEQRDSISDANMDCYFLRQDVSNKVRGQSTEYLPDVAQAADHAGALIKRGLTGYGQYFDVDLSKAMPAPLPGQPDTRLTGEDAEKILRQHLEPQQTPLGETPSLPLVLEDAVKTALFQSLAIIKVCGDFLVTGHMKLEQEPFFAELDDGTLIQGEPIERLILDEIPEWKLRIYVVRPKDIYLDPTGENRFIIEESECDYHEVMEAAQGEHALYDAEAVARMPRDFRDADRDAELQTETNESVQLGKSARKRTKLLEFWGDIIDTQGNLRYKNVMATVANEHTLIQRPLKNPYWHQRKPYVISPLIRVPFSVWHRAVFDYAVPLNEAENELFNLILDGAIQAVWGIREVQADMLENEKDIEQGIPQAFTALRKPEAPPGVPSIMVTQGGTVPPESLATLQLLSQRLQQATMINEIRLGQTPGGKTTATAVSEAQASSSMYFESIIFDLEQGFIQPLLWMSWLTLLQHVKEWGRKPALRNLIGENTARALAQMSPEQVFMTYGESAAFRVYGLSSVLARTKEFQKLMAFLDMMQRNDMLKQEAAKLLSPRRLIDQICRALNLDFSQLEMTDEEKLEQFGQMVQQSGFSGQDAMGNAEGFGRPSAPSRGGSSLPGEIRQVSNPMAGLNSRQRSY